VAGVGIIMTAEFWEYDTRLGRRWNCDPKPDASISSYSCFRNNPIWFSDPMGDTVKYSGLKEIVQVGLSRIFSSSFREKFNTLKKSTNTYTFKNIGKGSGTQGENLGRIEQDGDKKNHFNIKYTLKNANWFKSGKNQFGLSKKHALFEETYHAWDFETGLSGLSVVSDSRFGNVIGGENKEILMNAEGRAWLWTVNNTRGKKEGVSYFENGETIYAWPSFYGVLRKCVTHLEVKDYLYGSYKSTLFRYSYEELPDGRTARKVQEYKDFPLDGPYKK
jgi:hypothetical protein